jgi:hypothetical protein
MGLVSALTLKEERQKGPTITEYGLIGTLWRLLYSYSIGRDEQRSGRDGHAWTMFGRAKDVGVYHYTTSIIRLVWSELWYSGVG